MFKSIFLLRAPTLHYHGPDVMGQLVSQKVRLRQHIARIQRESLRNEKIQKETFLGIANGDVY